MITSQIRGIDGKEFEIASNLCFQCCDPPLGNHLFLVEQCTWSHPVMAPNPIDYKVWANVDGTQRGEEGDVSKEKERGGLTHTCHIYQKYYEE